MSEIGIMDNMLSENRSPAPAHSRVWGGSQSLFVTTASSCQNLDMPCIIDEQNPASPPCLTRLANSCRPMILGLGRAILGLRYGGAVAPPYRFPMRFPGRGVVHGSRRSYPRNLRSKRYLGVRQQSHVWGGLRRGIKPTANWFNIPFSFLNLIHIGGSEIVPYRNSPIQTVQHATSRQTRGLVPADDPNRRP